MDYTRIRVNSLYREQKKQRPAAMREDCNEDALHVNSGERLAKVRQLRAAILGGYYKPHLANVAGRLLESVLSDL